MKCLNTMLVFLVFVFLGGALSGASGLFYRMVSEQGDTCYCTQKILADNCQQPDQHVKYEDDKMVKKYLFISDQNTRYPKADRYKEDKNAVGSYTTGGNIGVERIVEVPAIPVAKMVKDHPSISGSNTRYSKPDEHRGDKDVDSFTTIENIGVGKIVEVPTIPIANIVKEHPSIPNRNTRYSKPDGHRGHKDADSFTTSKNIGVERIVEVPAVPVANMVKNHPSLPDSNTRYSKPDGHRGHKDTDSFKTSGNIGVGRIIEVPKISVANMVKDQSSMSESNSRYLNPNGHRDDVDSFTTTVEIPKMPVANMVKDDFSMPDKDTRYSKPDIYKNDIDRFTPSANIGVGKIAEFPTIPVPKIANRDTRDENLVVKIDKLKTPIPSSPLPPQAPQAPPTPVTIPVVDAKVIAKNGNVESLRCVEVADVGFPNTLTINLEKNISEDHVRNFKDVLGNNSYSTDLRLLSNRVGSEENRNTYIGSSDTARIANVEAVNNEHSKVDISDSYKTSSHERETNGKPIRYQKTLKVPVLNPGITKINPSNQNSQFYGSGGLTPYGYFEGGNGFEKNGAVVAGAISSAGRQAIYGTLQEANKRNRAYFSENNSNVYSGQVQTVNDGKAYSRSHSQGSGRGRVAKYGYSDGDTKTEFIQASTIRSVSKPNSTAGTTLEYSGHGRLLRYNPGKKFNTKLPYGKISTITKHTQGLHKSKNQGALSAESVVSYGTQGSAINFSSDEQRSIHFTPKNTQHRKN